MSEASSMDCRVGQFVRHEFTGWVCRACGYHAKWQTAADTHERRAIRGIGCINDKQQPNTEAMRHAAKDKR